jgi:hypothetical protein
VKWSIDVAAVAYIRRDALDESHCATCNGVRDYLCCGIADRGNDSGTRVVAAENFSVTLPGRSVETRL